MQLALWHKKTSNTPGKKPTPQVPLVWNQPHISPPTRNPWLAQKIDERNQIKNEQEESGKPMAHSSRQKEKAKLKQRSDHLRKLPHNQREGGQARLKRNLGGQAATRTEPAVLASPKNKKEIVQYHPPRGKPWWTVVFLVQNVKK